MSSLRLCEKAALVNDACERIVVESSFRADEVTTSLANNFAFSQTDLRESKMIGDTCRHFVCTKKLLVSMTRANASSLGAVFVQTKRRQMLPIILLSRKGVFRESKMIGDTCRHLACAKTALNDEAFSRIVDESSFFVQTT